MLRRSLFAAARLVMLTAAWVSHVSAAAAEGPGFALVDQPGQHLDVLLDGRLAARYMYAHDTAPEKRVATNKPYLHVFDAEGQQPITNGPRGVYPHHRGIFIGWRQIGFDGTKYDLWGMKDSAIVHEKFAGEAADAQHAAFTSVTHWTLSTGRTLLDEERTIDVRRAPAPGRLLIDFTARLTAVAGDLLLEGDPEHGGTQYRPAAEIDVKQTVYVYPKQNAQPHKDLDYPWVGESYTLADRRYSIVDLNCPQNPPGSRFSAYRDYGRFGAYFKYALKAGQSLTVKYAFVVIDGPMPPADYIEKLWDAYAGKTSPSAVPPTTVLPAEVTPPPKPKPAEKKSPAKAPVKAAAKASG